MKIYTEGGELAVEYEYDAWGAIVDISYSSAYEKIAKANCLLYRGYYYDFETGYYYLNSRYYDPQVKRFISPDNVNYLGAGSTIKSYNLYAYCSNNPVMYSDPSGNSLWDAIKNFVKNILTSIEIEVGIGIGIGVSGAAASEDMNVTAEMYRDNTLFIDDGKILLGNTVSSEASFLGFGIGGKHSQYTDGDHEDVHVNHGLSENVIDDASRIINCPNCKHNYTISKNITEKDSIDSLGVIGTSGSVHIGLGGHYSIGFNLKEFGNRFWSDFFK